MRISFWAVDGERAVRIGEGAGQSTQVRWLRGPVREIELAKAFVELTRR